MNIELRKKYYNLCNPIRFQDLDTGVILDIDNYEIDSKAVNARGNIWAETIADKIIWSDEPQSIYFSGYTGSGKTTELKRAIKILEDEETSNLLSVYIDSVEFFDRHSKIELIDVLSVIVYNVTVRVYEYIGKNKEEAFKKQGFFSELWTTLNADVDLKSGEIGLDGSKIIFEMKNRHDFRKRVRESIKPHITKFKDDVAKELTTLNELVKNYEKDKKRKSGIVVILDTLEKNRGISDEVDLVAKCAERLFQDRRSLSLPIHAIYTVPPYLSNIIDNIEFLPVIRLSNKDGSPYDEGITLMKALVHQRVPEEDLSQIIDDNKLEKVILFSGGYPRDLLEMLQKVIMSKSIPIDDEKLEKIFTELKNKYLEKTPREFYDKLRTIHETNELDVTQIEYRKMAFELFDSHAILRYRNGDLWWGLHPALKKVLKIDE